jgi:hypothetical protein
MKLQVIPDGTYRVRHRTSLTLISPALIPSCSNNRCSDVAVRQAAESIVLCVSAFEHLLSDATPPEDHFSENAATQNFRPAPFHHPGFMSLTSQEQAAS